MLHFSWEKCKGFFCLYKNISEMGITGAASLAGHVHKAQEGEH